MAGDVHYEFLAQEERSALLAGQQHLLEKEHYLNALNLAGARELGDIPGAQEQIAVAQSNLELIERKLAFLRTERARVDRARGLSSEDHHPDERTAALDRLPSG